MLKSVLAAGLNPSFGIHHRNHKNPYWLVDVLMEPYRPVVDQIVFRLDERGMTELDRENKLRLAMLASPEHALFAPSATLIQHMSGFVWAVWQQMDGKKVPLPSFLGLSEIEMERFVS